MVTDGIDRFRGGPRYRAFRYMSPDVDTASAVAQRTGTMIHTIFTRGVGRLGSNFWEINNGQNSIAKLSDETGGESYYLGMQNPVSFKPYLDSLQKALDNQYILEFKAIPGAKVRAAVCEAKHRSSGCGTRLRRWRLGRCRLVIEKAGPWQNGAIRSAKDPAHHDYQ